MIDQLIKHVNSKREIREAMTIPGKEISRTNRAVVSDVIQGHMSFLETKVPTTIITNPANNPWHKQRREKNWTDYSQDEFPPLSRKKTNRSNPAKNNNDTASTGSTQESETTLVDIEAVL